LPGTQPGKIREIREEPRFTLELQTIIPNAKRADEFTDGAKWRLSRDPFSGRRISNSHVWFVPMEEIPALLSVVIYYTFDDDYVNLLSIQETIYPPQD
jgi:hypothetical protein